jgi:FkbM family methyltransferase
MGTSPRKLNVILPAFLDTWLRATLKRRGYVFMRQTNPYYYLGRRIQLMRGYGIDLVLDVGANSGQYAKRLRSLGYAGRIVSFEPMREPFLALQAATRSDPYWACHDYGLGEVEATVPIHVSRNSVSSSLLQMLPSHEEHAPASLVVGDETIHVRRLDAALSELNLALDSHIWLKIDVQGFEHKVLAGAGQWLGKVAAIQIELSLVPLYDGQLTITPMLQLLSELGFDPVVFEPGFEDKVTGEYLQVDGIFRNRRFASPAAL